MGENVNAIMYQTLNAVPAAPSTMNVDVPEMLNFIVAKALAKDLDSRYQSARDMANDLRACRDGLLRSTSSVTDESVYQSSNSSNFDKVTSLTGEVGNESKQEAALGLSTLFDSMEATMRLASMTASEEDVEELSKTFRMVRPSIEDINRAAPVPRADFSLKNSSASQSYNQSTPAANGGGYILLAIIALVVIGLISTILF
jgi:serine/threonine-protein kinase